MGKSTFATIGILAVLLMSLGIVSAGATANNFSISMDGAGISPNNPAIGEDGESISFVINFTNNNLDYPLVNLNWSGVDISSGEKNDTGNTTFSPTVDISSSGSSHGLKVLVKNSTGDIIATLTKPIYYSSSTVPTEVLGCTNPTALNYNENATIGNPDSDKCTFPETPTTSYLCENIANPANLTISIESIDVQEGFGDDEDYWYPLDEIEIEIEIKNDGDDVEDIEMTFCLYDTEKDKCILDEDDVNLDEDDFDLDDGDDQTVFITFQINPDDLSENNDYEIRIGATGEVDDSASDFDENMSCVEKHEDIEIRTNDKFVIVNKIEFEALSGIFEDDKFLAGSQVKISGEVWNIGDEDIDDDEIFLRIYSKLLGINEIVEFDSGINSLDSEMFEKVITIPADAQERSYTIEFTVYDDENMADKDIYKNNEDDEAEYSAYISVQVNIPKPTISANLESPAEIGTDLIVKATVTNNGNDNDFLFSVSGFESWADLVSVTPQTDSIDEGESTEVMITLNPKVAGTQSFKINAIVDGESYDQSVSVNIAEKPGIFNGMNNILVYVIIGIIAVLILIFLVLLAKFSRRQAKPQF